MLATVVSTTKATTTSRTQAKWAKTYYAWIQAHHGSHSHSTHQFSLVDMDNNGTPEFFLLSSGGGSRPSLYIGVNEYATFATSNDSYEVFYSGNNIWVIYTYNDTETIERHSLANPGFFVEIWRCNAPNYTYRTSDENDWQNITADEYEAAKRKAESGMKVRFEHTYIGGDINLEDYWP